MLIATVTRYSKRIYDAVGPASVLAIFAASVLVGWASVGRHSSLILWLLIAAVLIAVMALILALVFAVRLRRLRFAHKRFEQNGCFDALCLSNLARLFFRALHLGTGSALLAFGALAAFSMRGLAISGFLVATTLVPTMLVLLRSWVLNRSEVVGATIFLRVNAMPTVTGFEASEALEHQNCVQTALALAHGDADAGQPAREFLAILRHEAAYWPDINVAIRPGVVSQLKMRIFALRGVALHALVAGVLAVLLALLTPLSVFPPLASPLDLLSSITDTPPNEYVSNEAESSPDDRAQDADSGDDAGSGQNRGPGKDGAHGEGADAGVHGGQGEYADAGEGGGQGEGADAGEGGGQGEYADAGEGGGQGEGADAGEGGGQGEGADAGEGGGQGEGADAGEGGGQGEGADAGEGGGQGEGADAGEGGGQGEGADAGEGGGQGEGADAGEDGGQGEGADAGEGGGQGEGADAGEDGAQGEGADAGEGGGQDEDADVGQDGGQGEGADEGGQTEGGDTQDSDQQPAETQAQNTGDADGGSEMEAQITIEDGQTDSAQRETEVSVTGEGTETDDEDGIVFEGEADVQDGDPEAMTSATLTGGATGERAQNNATPLDTNPFSARGKGPIGIEILQTDIPDFPDNLPQAEPATQRVPIWILHLEGVVE